MKKSILNCRAATYLLAVILELLPVGSIWAAPALAPVGEIPSRVILTWNGDPAHTQHVTWHAETALGEAKAQIAPLNANPNFRKDAKTVSGKMVRVDLPGGKSVGQYSAEFTGLEPDTSYCYRVGNGRTWSEWNVFRTPRAEAAPFRFLYLGDAQNDIRSMCSRLIRTAYQKTPDARFIALAGDLVAEGHDDRLWGELCDSFGFISATMPLLPVVGNHDLHQPGKKKSWSTPESWRRHFGLPHNGPRSVEELDQQAYYLDYQGVRLLVVDANVFAEDPESKVPGRRPYPRCPGGLDREHAEE